MKNLLHLFTSSKEYYEELYEVFQKAEQSIFILGWDIHSEVDLMPHKKNLETPSVLVNLLRVLALEKKELQIYLLPWEYALLYAAERDPLLNIKFSWGDIENIHFEENTSDSIGSSHHQKIVMVDETLVYCGGIDLTVKRWDDEYHTANNPFRAYAKLFSYAPYHDYQIRCSGPIVVEFKEILKNSWQKNTGELPDFQGKINNNFLGRTNGIPLNFTDVELIQTQPMVSGGKEKREIETAYYKLIQSSKKSIYIENQYFTSNKVTEAIIEILKKDNPPEIVIILPKKAGGWLELETMGRLQYQQLNRLVGIDSQKKLKILYPFHRELPENEYMTVHSKIMIVDNEKLIIGSANLNNRSMGLDTESCLLIAGEFKELRDYLISIISGTELNKIKANSSLFSCIKSIQEEQNNRSLLDFDLQIKPFTIPNELMPDQDLIDQEKPSALAQKIQVIQNENKPLWEKFNRGDKNLSLIVTIIFAVLLAILWNYFPETNYYKNNIESFVVLFKSSEYAWGITLGLFALSGLLFIPINIVIIFIATSFEPLDALLYILTGSVFCVFVTYIMGYVLARLNLTREKYKTEKKVIKLLKNSSLPFLIILRIIPTMPNSILGIAAGNIGISLWKFLLSSFIGFIPGTLGLVFFQKSLISLIKDPSLISFLILGGLIALTIFAYTTMKKRFNIYNGDK